MKIADFDIIFQENEGGGYLARCDDIQGAFTEGETPEDAIANCISVIDMIIAYRHERNERILLKEQRETESVSVSIEAGLVDSEAGRTTDVPEVRAKFGLPA